jgi:hypothetical protein
LLDRNYPVLNVVLLDVPKGGRFADMVALKGDKEIGDRMNMILHGCTTTAPDMIRGPSMKRGLAATPAGVGSLVAGDRGVASLDPRLMAPIPAGWPELSQRRFPNPEGSQPLAGG